MKNKTHQRNRYCYHENNSRILFITHNLDYDTVLSFSCNAPLGNGVINEISAFSMQLTFKNECHENYDFKGRIFISTLISEILCTIML